MRSVMLCIVALLFSWGLPASAQSDQPVEPRWSAAVSALSRALAEGAPEAMVALLADDAVVESLDQNNAGGAVRLLARTRRGVPVAARAYHHPPAGMASDIAADFRNADLPEAAKREMMLRAGAHEHRANATAEEWLSEALGARSGDLVGVIVFWCDGTPDSQHPAAGPVFILLKGELTGSSEARIKAIAFGNPRRQTRS